MVRWIGPILLVALACAQESRLAYPLPPSSDFVVRKDLPYRSWDGHDLLMDAYRPSKLSPGARLPVLVILNTLSQSRRSDSYYIDWATLAAAHGFVAINFDIHDDGLEEDFDRMIEFLAGHAAELNAEANQVAVYAASGNVSRALPLVENPRRTVVKAAVIYYGAANVQEFRLDLPVLYVRAGLDRPGVNQQIDALSSTAIRQNAPVTFINHAGGHHAFELIDHNDATREVIERTFAFLKSALTPAYQDALRAGIPEAKAAGAVLMGDFSRAAELYAPLARAHPNDPRILLSYAESLLGARRYQEARTQFDRVKAIGGVGPRDLALPAAKACLLDGDPKTAVEWLKTIPKRFLPQSLRDDTAFASLRDRADFQELFR
jgi:tetratricopeptide (TPR) repeat protein